MNNSRQEQEDHSRDLEDLDKDFQALKDFMINLKGNRKEVLRIHLEIYSLSLKRCLEEKEVNKLEEVQDNNNNRLKVKTLW